MPTGLAAAGAVTAYVQEARKIRNGWDTLAQNRDRIAALHRPAVAALKAAGVPDVIAMEDPFGNMVGTATNAAFNRGTWTTWYNPDFVRTGLSDQEFWRRANVAYHEARHAEQTFRVARKLAAEKKNPAQIRQLIGIPDAIAALAVATPLPAGDKTAWDEAAAWQLNMEKGPDGNSPGDLVNAMNDTAQDRYNESRSLWRPFELVINNDPAADATLKSRYDAAVARPDSKAVLDQTLEGLKANYVLHRERAKQCYRQYTAMPVEADAWATGGQVEQAAGLSPWKADDELANLDKDERTMTPIMVMALLTGGSPKEKELLAAIGKLI